MKQTLTLLILCFAFVANAQNHIGVSVTEGYNNMFKKPYSNFHYNIGVPKIGFNYNYGIKKHRISPSIGICYSPYQSRGIMTFIDYQGNPVATGKASITYFGISCPIDLWISILKNESKIKGGITVGSLTEYFFLLKSEIRDADIKSMNDINFFNQGLQSGIFLMLNQKPEFSFLINLEYSYLPSVRHEEIGFSNFFIRGIILFGK